MDDEILEGPPSDPDEIHVQKGNKKKRSLRNLVQFKNLSDDEFNQLMTKRQPGVETSEEYERGIEKRLQEFEQDYDLSDLKINDKSTLRALIQAIITLEDYEQFLYKLRAEGISNSSLQLIEKLQKVMSDLRGDISKLQNDLVITRKIRKSDQDLSVMAYLDNLKEKAKKFYESKTSYIFCPKCNMLLANIWTLYPHNERNKIVLICERTLEDGKKCGEKVVVSSKDLIKNRGTNNRKITPESML